MKITFIGSSHGVPSDERYCSCIMLEINDAIYFIDAGAPLIDELLRRGKDINKVRAVFTTHSHGDHTSGLFNMASLIDWYYKNASVEFYLTDAEIQSLLQEYMRVTAYKSPTYDRTKMVIVEEGKVYQDENIRVNYIRTKHPIHENSELPAYAILIEAEGKRVLFSGDLSAFLLENDFPQIALEEEIDVMVLEFSHFKYENVENYLRRCKVKQMWFNHVYPFTKFDMIKEVREEYTYPMYIAADGDEIEL